jgi:hypothetical protein
VKNVIGILMGIALNLQIAFGSIAIFTTLILQIHEHGRSSHLLVFCSISSVICSFHCSDLSLPSINLFLDFFWGLFTWFLSQSVNHWYIEELLTFGILIFVSCYFAASV